VVVYFTYQIIETAFFELFIVNLPFWFVARDNWKFRYLTPIKST
jgi:hypothetical protein